MPEKLRESVSVAYHENAEDAKVHAALLRSMKMNATVIQTKALGKPDVLEPIIFMSDVPEHEVNRIVAMYEEAGIALEYESNVVPGANRQVISAVSKAIKNAEEILHVEIPENYKEMAWLELQALYQKIVGPNERLKTKKDAFAAIEKELERRKAAQE